MHVGVSGDRSSLTLAGEQRLTRARVARLTALLAAREAEGRDLAYLAVIRAALCDTQEHLDLLTGALALLA